MRDAWARVLVIAGRQHGAFSRPQGLAAGLTARQIGHALQKGRLVAIHRAVYRDAAALPGPLQPLAAACLATGQGALASHRSAATVWGVETPPSPPEVSVPQTRHPLVSGITVYRSFLRRGDRTVHKGIPVTTPLRTIIDLASVLDEDTCEEALDDFVRRGFVRLDRVVSALGRSEHATRSGTSTLRRLAAIRVRATGSRLESRVLPILRRANLPAPTLQHPVRTRHGRRFIDLAYPEQMVAVEVDGYESHTTRAQFDDDRVRRADLRQLGWEIPQITWTMVETDPVDVAYTVGRALGLAPIRWAPQRKRT